MIFTQGRESIVKAGKEIYVLKIQDTYHIMNKYSSDEVIDLGEYSTPGVASKVLKDIFQFIRSKKETYCMPDKF